jgi:hypothetical protein
MLGCATAVAAALSVQAMEVSSGPEAAAPVAVVSAARSPFILHGFFAGVGGGAAGVNMKWKQTETGGKEFANFKKNGGAADVVIGYVHALQNGFAVGARAVLGFPFAMKKEDLKTDDDSRKAKVEQSIFSPQGDIIIGFTHEKMRGAVCLTAGFAYANMKIEGKFGSGDTAADFKKDIPLFAFPVGGFYAFKCHKNIAICVGGDYRIGMKKKEKIGAATKEVEFSLDGWTAYLHAYYNL